MLPNERLSPWRVERHMLVLAVIFVTVNALALVLQRPERLAPVFITLAVWIVCTVSGHLVLNRILPRRDHYLYPAVMFLAGWGLIAISRLAPTFGQRQTLWLLFGTVALLAMTYLPHVLRWLRLYRYLWLIFGLGLLVSTILFGSSPAGVSGTPQLWLQFGPVYIQPSEVLKIILVAFLASYLAEQYPSLRAEGVVAEHRPLEVSPRILGPVFLMWGLSIVMLVWQRDLGTAVVFFAVFIVLVYAASGYTAVLIGGAALIGIAAVGAYLLFDLVQLRIDIWLNPWPESAGDAYQLVQSLQAFAAGGPFGEGIGQGLPTAIPVVHSDFLFAAIGEEWGLLGVIVVISIFALITLRGLIIALNHNDRPFYVLLAVGLSALIAVQSLLIMGGATRLLPITGVTLPFMSYGGSSLLVSFVIVGLLLRLSGSQPDTSI